MRLPERLLWIACFLLASTGAFAQANTIRGRITDIQTGKPLSDVTVSVRNSATSTVTDADGNFIINPGSLKKVSLLLTIVGYGPQELAVKGDEFIRVSMQPEASGLNEVVVVGYGTQKRANLTGAVGTVKSDAFADRSITNASQALAGQIAGLWVNQTSGQPGVDGATINIRGIGTFGNSSPLVLIDGIQGSFNSVNPNDIESISVLKDASSSAIYGSRAANGVILIVTKSGKKGPLHVDLNSYWGQQQATILPKMVNNSVEAMELYNQAMENEGQADHYSQSTIDEYKNGTDPLIYPNNDWMHLIIRPAAMQEHNVRLSGGKEATQYSVSLGYLDQDGIVKNDQSKRYSLNFNLRSKVSDRFDWGIHSNLINSVLNQSYYSGFGYNSTIGMLTELVRAMPFDGTYTADGRYASTWVNAVNAQFNNPLAMVDNGLNRTTNNSVNGNAFFNLELLKGLKWNVTGGINYLDNLQERFIPELYVYDPRSGDLKNRIGNDSRSLSNLYSKSLLTTFYSTLSYNKKILRDHEITALVGFNREKYTDKYMNAYIEGFLSNSLTELNAGSSNKNVSGGGTDYGIRSVFGRLNYAFRDKYLLEANLRYDGSSRFAAANRWGVFPSFSAGWRIDKEAFMKDQQIFSNLKLRASWGRLGNDQIGLYSWIPTLSLGSDYYFNGQPSSGVAQTAVSNPDITWESATKTDVGIEAGFLQNRLSIEFDYFNDLRQDILRNINLPWTVGDLAAPAENLASVRNKGWEFSTNYTQNFGKLRLSGGFNVTHVTNEVVKIPDPQVGFLILKEGESMNAFYMWKATGIFKSQEEVDNSPVPVGRTTLPGDIKFEDVGGPDGKPDGKIDADDRQVVGKPIPTWTYGIHLSAAYGGFDLGVLMQGVAGVQSYVGGELYFPFLNGAGVPDRWEAGNTWTPDHVNAKLPRLLQYSAPTWNYENNSFWLQDASFLRVKNIQIGYSVPDKLISRLKVIKGLRIYANGQNLFTFTKFEGLDPERFPTNTTGANQYPNIRIITGGVNIKF